MLVSSNNNLKHGREQKDNSLYSQIIIPLICAILAILFPWWFAVTVTIVVTLFFDSIALLIVAWIIAFQNQNASILYVCYWIAGALIAYIILSYVQKTFIR